MSKQIESNLNTIETSEIEDLRKTIRQSWVTSGKAIYAFGKKHSRASIEASLKDLGLSVTKKANAFSGAAKLGLSEYHEGKWHVCDAQVSRYSKICKYLNSLKVDVDDVEQALAGKTMTELVQQKSKKANVTDDQVQIATRNIEQTYAASKLFNFGDDVLPISSEAGLKPGINMAAVVCDMAGNITAIRCISGVEDRHFREKLWSAAGSKEVAGDVLDPVDPVEDAKAAAKVA